MAWSMPPPKKMKPSASRAARSKAASPDPPSQIGMDRAGFGTSAALSTRSKRPEKSTTGSVNNRRSSPICSSCLAPRVRKSCPRASYSTWFQPTPTPRRSRPPDRRSTSAACRATSAVWRCGRTRIPVAKRIRSVMPAKIGEHHERVVERVALGVGAGQRGRPTGMNGTEHVVVGEKVVKAQVLDRSPDSPDSARISAKLGLRVDGADLHGAGRRLLQGLHRAFS